MANYVSKHSGAEIDKVIDEALLFSEQSLTEEEKNQVKANLGFNDLEVESVIEQNIQSKQKFWRGTKAEYDAIEEKDDLTLYIVIDDYTVEIAGAMKDVPVSTADNGKFLRVVDGVWAAATINNAEEGSF